MGILAVNLVAIYVRVYFQCVPFKSKRKEVQCLSYSEFFWQENQWFALHKTDAVYKLCTKAIRK